MNEQGQQQQVITAIATYLYELFKEDSAIECDKAFYRCKDHFKGMQGIGKDQFKPLFEASLKEFGKPLVQAMMGLASLEPALKARACEVIQNHTPKDPDETRHLSGVLQQLRHGHGDELNEGLVSAYDLCDSELRAELVACWPGLLGVEVVDELTVGVVDEALSSVWDNDSDAEAFDSYPNKTKPGNTKVSGAKVNVRDIEFYGDGDMFKCISKAWSKAEGWMKSTKAMNVPGGIVVQVSTQQDGNVAEAVCFVPGVAVESAGDNYKLAPRKECNA